jgi:hypothetical protein
MAEEFAAALASVLSLVTIQGTCHEKRISRALRIGVDTRAREFVLANVD